jgi:hypothetical protein
MSDARAAFLERSGWGAASAAQLAGDASARVYQRLSLPDGARAVLMIAPGTTPAERASLDAFRRIGAHLRHLGLSAPEEFAADPKAGFLLMEDLGDKTMAGLLDRGAPETEAAYAAAARVLPVLAVAPAPAGLRAPGAEGMAEMVDLTFDMLEGEGTDVASLRARTRAALADALVQHAGGAPVLALRDVHGDNLIWLPDRVGPARVGLLDYQDALRLPSGYDLASLLDDVRRDVPDAWRKNLVEEFSVEEGLSPPEGATRIDLLSLQRNLRILGVFRRLQTRLGKPGYARFVPRTRTLVARAARNPGLSRLSEPVADILRLTESWERGS